MPTRRKTEWSYPLRVGTLARELHLPYTRVHNASLSVGVKEIKSEEDMEKIVLHLTTQGAHPEALVKVFGSAMTLGQLSKQMEERLGPAIPA